jgi:hypothetical protein
MRDLLAEYRAWFEPDEVQILVAAFDKAWETVQASGMVYAEANAEAVRAYSQNILLRPLGKVSATTPDCGMALCWL